MLKWLRKLFNEKTTDVVRQEPTIDVRQFINTHGTSRLRRYYDIYYDKTSPHSFVENLGFNFFGEFFNNYNDANWKYVQHADNLNGCISRLYSADIDRNDRYFSDAVAGELDIDTLSDIRRIIVEENLVVGYFKIGKIRVKDSDGDYQTQNSGIYKIVSYRLTGDDYRHDKEFVGAVFRYKHFTLPESCR